MSIFFEYGNEHHDEFITHGVIKCGGHTAVTRFIREYQCQGTAWYREITEQQALEHDEHTYDHEAEEHEAMIDANIAAALRRKRLARHAYKAPTLRDLWPAGA